MTNENTLSERESLVLDLIGRGLSSKQIARELKISPRTVEGYRHVIERKIACKPITYFYRKALEAQAA